MSPLRSSLPPCSLHASLLQSSSYFPLCYCNNSDTSPLFQSFPYLSSLLILSSCAALPLSSLSPPFCQVFSCMRGSVTCGAWEGHMMGRDCQARLRKGLWKELAHLQLPPHASPALGHQLPCDSLRCWTCILHGHGRGGTRSCTRRVPFRELIMGCVPIHIPDWACLLLLLPCPTCPADVCLEEAALALQSIA